VKKKFFIVVAHIVVIASVYFLLRYGNDLVLDAAGAAIPALGLVLYVVLDHFWSDLRV
jgi:hypothetical protein